jgi:energy-coupling factor transporter ATP-binding protein EcfA2
MTLRAQDLEEKKLVLMLGPRILEDYRVANPNTKADEFSKLDLIKSIREGCDDMGLFDNTRVRGPGLYRKGDELVVNFGDQVANSEGSPVHTAPEVTGAAYQSGPDLGFSMQTPVASKKDIDSLVGAMKTFCLRRSGDAKLLLGWFAMAFYGPVLSHRPIVAITAERGAGKTTMLELFAQLLGPQAMRRDGVPTVAQVIYELDKRPAALLVDELEARRSKVVAIENFLETLRIGFSNSSGHRLSRVIGGKQRYFNAPAGVLVAGIGLPAFNPATESRTVRICLNALEKGSQASYQPLFDSAREHETTALGSRVRRLLLTRWSVMRESMNVVRPMLIALGHESRSADKYTPLIAGYLALTGTAVPVVEELRALLSELELLKPNEQVVERDADVCLGVLLDRKVAMFLPRESQTTTKLHMTIREVVQVIVHGPDDVRKPLTMQLEDFGVRPLWSRADKAWRLAVCASEHHTGMRRLMQRTDWALGGWKDVLLRMPGAESMVQKVAKSAQRVVVMDMPPELMMPLDEGTYEFPDADIQIAIAELVE